MANTAFDHASALTLPGSTTNNGLVRWGDTSAGSFGNITGITSDGSNLTLLTRGEIRFSDADSTHYIALESPATVSTSYTMALPAAVPSANDYLKVTSYSGGAGVLEWASVSADTNTTYSTSWVDSSNDVILRLTPSTGSADDLTIVAGSNITLTPSGDNLTIAAAGGGSGDLSFGGDTFGQDRVIGSNDAYDLGFETTGATRMTIDSGGNVGVGTTSPDSTLQVVGTATIGSDAVVSPQRRLTVYGTGAGYGPLLVTDSGHSMIDLVSRHNNGHSYAIASRNDGTFQISDDTAGAVRLRISDAGKVGLDGVTTPNGNLSIGTGNAVGSITAPAIQVGQGNSNTFRLGLYSSAEGGHLHNNNGNDGIILESRDIEVARFWASGSNRHVGFGGITTPNDTMFKVEYSAQSWVANFANAHGSGSNHVMQMNFQGFSPDNDGNNLYLYCADTSAARFKIMSNGDYWSSDGGSVNSDATLKNSITDASSKLEDVLNLKVRNFYWNEDVHPNADMNQKKMIGFIAQEFEEVFPGLVSESEFIYDSGIMKKSIKTTALIPILVKAIQELKAEVDALRG